jgi:molybdenum cofactor synthesis domain-containing protein
MADEKIWTAALIVIGDEILSGRTQDLNIAALAKWLGGQGIRLRTVRVVPDEMGAIAEGVNALKPPAHDYLFTTGGIGPTHDDITVDAIAAALDVPVVVHPEAEAILRTHYQGEVTPARLRMARVPEGASLIPNTVTGAPGIRHGNIFIMAGVPFVTRGMLAAMDGTLPGGKPLLSRSIGAQVGESAVADLLRATEKAHPQVQIGSYPFWKNRVAGANFVIRSADREALDACAEDLLARLRAEGIDATDGEIG